MRYEYYYLFGLDIPLQQYGLGIIRQPKILDFINKDISMDEFYSPFILSDILIGQSENKDNLLKLRSLFGELGFLLSIVSQGSNKELVNLLKKVLSIIYDTDDVRMDKDFKIVINKEIIVDNSNFNILKDVILESQRIDKSKFKFEEKSKKILDPIEARFEYFRNKSKKKKVEPDMVDMLNFIIHSSECNLDYNKVLNMTIYQVKNTLETLGYKHSYETMFQYKLSQKFNIKEDVKYWNERKIVKSSSIDKDV